MDARTPDSRFLLSSLLALALSVGLSDHAVAAEAPNPVLRALVNGIDDESRQRPLAIRELNIDVSVEGSIARTTLTATFANPTQEVLEGDFQLALPKQAVVVGYALDVDGRMLDGVLVPQPKARTAYEDKVRQGIDPGLAEVSRDDTFSTHVFPIRPKAGRTIRLAFVAPIDMEAGLVLPLHVDAVGKVAVRLHARGVSQAPDARLPEGEVRWLTNHDGYLAEWSGANATLSGAVTIAPVAVPNGALVVTHPNGERFFQVREKLAAAVERRSPRRLRIYWDQSLSRRDDQLDREIELAARYVEAVHPKTVDVVTFASGGVRVVESPTPARLREYLKSLAYRGATSFAVLNTAFVAEADRCLLFSDGVVTIDSRDALRAGCEITAITSAADADVGYLAHLSGGAEGVLRIGTQSTDELVARLRTTTPRVVSVRDSRGHALGFGVMDLGASHRLIVGEAPMTGDIVVQSRSSPRRYAVTTQSGTFDGPATLWAAQRIAQLAAEGVPEKALPLSRKYSVASPGVAFLVLESARDYVSAEIEPPKSAPAELLAEYREARAVYDAERKAARAERLSVVLERWREQKTWWNERFDKRPPPAAKVEVRAQRRQESVLDSPMPALTMERPLNQGAVALEDVAVTGNYVAPTGGNITTIELEPWNPDRPYLKALDAAWPEICTTLSREEEKHGAMPAFYLDVSEWLHRRGRNAESLDMLLSALELPSRNEETLIVVASRLKRYQSLDRAIDLYEQVLRLIPDRPQPRRDLALALAKRAAAQPAYARRDLERALALLDEIVMTPWDDRFEGIELIALMEANALIPSLQQAGSSTQSLDSRLVALLDVDLRVVIEWNTAATDMDLWIDEPGGERAIYSNPRTYIGGRLSNDMTSGFGPEEYLLRRAPKGRYRVSVNVYHVDAINPNGSTVITARLIRGFGRPSMHEEVVDLELKPGEDGERLVGEIVVSPDSE